MKKITQKLLLFISIAVFSASCTPYLYIPNTLNMPLAGSKGEIKANIYSGSGGFGLQGSYAADSHLVVLADVALLNDDATKITLGTTVFPSSINNFVGDIGAGYYMKLSKTGRFEALGGIGYGTARSTTFSLDNMGDIVQNDLNGRFYRLFVQGNVGSVNEKTEIGFGMRIGTILKSGTYKVTTADSGTTRTTVFNTSLNGAAVFVEPCVNFGAGMENVKVNLTLGYSGKVTGADVDPDFGHLYQSFFITGGITVNLFRQIE